MIKFNKIHRKFIGSFSCVEKYINCSAIFFKKDKFCRYNDCDNFLNKNNEYSYFL